jgi:hypothetical protein
MMGTVTNLKTIRSGIFWGEVAPSEHLVQIYANDDTFLDALEGFVGSGLRAGESVIVLASAAHLHDLEKRLRHGSWIDVDRARWEDRYIALLARETLDKFMVNGWPDEQLFERAVTPLITRARGEGRRVRAFGEMVALLWAEGNAAATIRLEHLWNKLVAAEKFPLFCAYPLAGFTQDAAASLQTVCDTHSRAIPGYV